MIEQFNMHNIRLLQEQGYTVHVAANFEKGNTISNERMVQLRKELAAQNVQFFQIDFSRNAFDIRGHAKAYSQLKKISKLYDYSIMHCHSPIGGVVARLVFRNTPTKVIYTAHGFHFFQGGKKLEWLLFYPVEYICSYFTDVLITINNEDYQVAKGKFHAKQVYKINGVGIELEKFISNRGDKEEIRKQYHIKQDDFVLFSIGELSDRKNHIVILEALKEIEDPTIKYFIIGQGRNQEKLEQFISKNQLDKNVFLLGYQKRVDQILPMADLFCFPSKQEGLPVALMEAMATGLPCFVSDIRGNNELIDENGGVLHSPMDIEEVQNKLKILKESNLEAMAMYNLEKIKEFSITEVATDMNEIYKIFNMK